MRSDPQQVRRRQMDRVEGAYLGWQQGTGEPEDPIADPHEVDASQHVFGSVHRIGAEREEGAGQLGPGERSGDQGATASKVATQGV